MVLAGMVAILVVFGLGAAFMLREHLRATPGVHHAKILADPKELLLEQWKALRAEQDKLFDNTLQAERYVLIAAGAIYTFLFTQFTSEKIPSTSLLPSAWLAWWIPFVLVCVGALRCLAFYGRIELIGEYLRLTERSAGITGSMGWNNWLHDSKKFGTAALAALTLASWLVMAEGTWYLSFIGAREHQSRSRVLSQHEAPQKR